MIEDISVNWIYKENFSVGNDNGFINITQYGNSFTGKMHYVETIYGEESFTICQTVEGFIEGNQIQFSGVGYDILKGDDNIEYELDSWVGEITDNGIIIGSSEDEEGVCGVFVMQRK